MSKIPDAAPSPTALRSYARDTLMRLRNVDRILLSARTWTAAGFPLVADSLLCVAREEAAVLLDEATARAELTDSWGEVAEREAQLEALDA